jgi:formylglycine-generating enzyme required for sulfatase activity
MILLDGLDECGDALKRGRVRAAVDEMTRNTGDHCRFLLTARPYARPEGADPQQGIYMLDDLDDGQIGQFIHDWYAALVKHGWRAPGDAKQKRDDLLAAHTRSDLRVLAGNPLLLTLMATLHSIRGRLPDDRADLYSESVDLLLARWNQHIGTDRALLDALDVPGLKLSDLREALEALAFDIHARNIGREGTADIPEHRLVNAFLPLLNQSKDKADRVVDYIEKRAGLLMGQGDRDGQDERQFTFPHRTFQEFLAACHLANGDDLPAQCRKLAEVAPGHWQEVLILAARRAGIERGASAADELVGGQDIQRFRAARQPDVADWTRALLAARQLLEIGLRAIHARERTRAIAARVADWLVAALPVHPDQGGLPVVQRALAGDVLSALGDPRFDSKHYHLPADDQLGFVYIPADPEFRIGTRKANRQRVADAIGRKVGSREINDKLTPTPGFYIARYPVTIGQYKSFIQACNYKIRDDLVLSNQHNRPVCYISWNEALDYCDWLNDRLANSNELKHCSVSKLVRGGGWRATLPSELEWEKAARGGLLDAVFPWGNDPDPSMANYDATGVGATTSVGCFPANRFDLYDMVGNIWEWTRSIWQPYPYDQIEHRESLNSGDAESRVFRGGAWGRQLDVARCAFRWHIRPDNRDLVLGFRVVLCSVLFLLATSDLRSSIPCIFAYRQNQTMTASGWD